MDAQKFGAFIAQCRKENHMTQAQLAVKIHVTDKAVSRWERGVGFPDIHTLEPLAKALGISVLELMKSERITTNDVTSREADDVLADTLDAVKIQQKQERKNILVVLGGAAVLVLFLLVLDSMKWQIDALIFEGVGVVFPLFCMLGTVALLGSSLWRKLTGRPCSQTLALAAALPLLLLILAGFFFLAGALGIGPVPN